MKVFKSDKIPNKPSYDRLQARMIPPVALKVNALGGSVEPLDRLKYYRIILRTQVRSLANAPPDVGKVLVRE